MSYLTLEFDQILGPDGSRWAALSNANSLTEPPPPRPLSPAGRTVAWSGWSGGGADARAGRFPRDFRTWTGAAWAAMDAWIARFPGELILRPHARHVLSDAQSCMTFLRRHEEREIGLLLDPISMLTTTMLDRAEDHLMRILQALGDHPRIAAVVIAGGERAFDDAEEDSLRPVAGGSMPDHALVQRLVEDLVPPQVPRVRIGSAGAGLQSPSSSP